MCSYEGNVDGFDEVTIAEFDTDMRFEGVSAEGRALFSVWG